MSAHCKFSSSASSRWIACPGSIRLSEKAPPSRGSSYADEGTNAHACLEAFIKAWQAGKPLSLKQMVKRSYTEEMATHAYNAWQEIIKLAPVGADVFSETKCSLDFIHEDMGGTTDCVIIEMYGALIVIDFKYGVMPVSAEENSQLVSYALAIAHKHDYEFSRVDLVIIQPRALDVEERGVVRTWSTSIDRLREWADVFAKARDEALAEKPRYSPSDENCKYCPAAPICPALRDQSLRDVQADFDVEDASIALPVVTDKTYVPNLGLWLNAASRLEIWIEKLREHAHSVIEGGGSVDGYKIVQRRSTRKWIEPKGAARIALKQFGDSAFSQPELLSPAQFEKKVGELHGKDTAARFTHNFTVSESSGTTLVLESDPRPAFNFFEAEFKEIECAVESAKKNLSDAQCSSNRSAKTVTKTKTNKRKKR